MPEYTYEKSQHIFPTLIETDRLLFKRITPELLPITELYEKYSNISPKATRYVTFEPHKNPHETLEWITEKVDDFKNGNTASYFIFPKETNEYTVSNLIGATGIEPDWNTSTAESGIFLFEEHWGNGYSTERGKMMLHLAFTQLDLNYYLSRCDPKNTQSQKAIENYLYPYGGEKLGKLPTEHQLSGDQVLIYKLTRDQYEKHTK